MAMEYILAIEVLRQRMEELQKKLPLLLDKYLIGNIDSGEFIKSIEDIAPTIDDYRNAIEKLKQ